MGLIYVWSKVVSTETRPAQSRAFVDGTGHILDDYDDVYGKGFSVAKNPK